MAEEQYAEAAADVVSAAEPAAAAEDVGLITSIFNEITGSYLNIALVVLIAWLLYKIYKSRADETARVNTPPEPELPKLRRDFTIQELKQYDGTQPDGRVLMAVNGTVYDVSRGKRFYGPGTYIFFSSNIT